MQHRPSLSDVAIRSLALLGAVAALRDGCAPVPPETRTFAPGRFAYEARWVPPGRVDTVTRRGWLAIDRVRPESLAGRWEVPGYLPGFPNADFSVRSYYLTALAVEDGDTLVVSHYLDRADGAPTPACRLSVATRTAGYSAEGGCRLTRLP